MMRSASALILALVCFVTACGGDEPAPQADAETKTYVKKESTRLKEEGSPLSAEDEARREEERRRKREEFEAAKKTSKLASRLARAEDDFDAAEIVGEIGELGPAGATLLPQLEALLAREDAELRIQVYRAVGAIGGAEASRILRKSFEDEEDAVKAAGLDAWRRAGIADVSPALRFLDDVQDAAVQRAALGILLASADLDRHLPVIVEKLPDLSGAAVKPGLEALARRETRVPGLAGLLVALVDHQEAPVRALAIREIGRLNEKKMSFAEALVRCLGDDPDLRVRTEAHRLMRAWAGADEPPAYEPDAEREALQAAGEAWKAWLTRHAAKFTS